MSPALLLFANTPYQGPDWTTSDWLRAAAFPKRLTELVANWGSPDSEVSLRAMTRGRGQGHSGATLRARIVHLNTDLGTPVLIFHHGDPLPAPGASGEGPLLPRRSFLVPVGVPAEPQVLDSYSAVLRGDLGRLRELSPGLLWEVAFTCWLPQSREVVCLLQEAMLRSFRELAAAARVASRTLSALPPPACKGKGCPL